MDAHSALLGSPASQPTTLNPPEVVGRFQGQFVGFTPDLQGLVADSERTAAWAAGQEPRTLDDGSDVLSVAVSADGSTIVTGGDGGTVKVWAAGQEPR
ncbi:MAG: hypothetical protein HC812_18220 [Leptolyngbya sp. RL_3_1]|nr:hypothetical protein [Leptolyngbya sp. RL_3_1]